MREALGSAMHTSDLTTQEWECATDRLGALAFGNALGSAMLWATLTGEQRRLFGLAEMVADRIKGRTGRAQDCLPIASLAILERMYPHCRTCNGAGEGKNEAGVLVDCPVCGGSGKHCYSDDERSKFVGMSWRPRLSRLLEFASLAISSAELDALIEVRRQLEKTK